MTADVLISPLHLAAGPNDRPDEILSLLLEQNLEEVPFVADDAYKGLVSRDLVTHLVTLNQDFGYLDTEHLPTEHLLPQFHLLQVLQVFAETGRTLLPVVDANQRYIGPVEAREAYEAINDWLPIAEPGAVVTLEMSWNNYSLQQLAGIAENNDTKILGSYLQRINDDDDNVLVTLKFNREEIPGLLQAMERYGLRIVGSYSRSRMGTQARDHYKALMRYLNV